MGTLDDAIREHLELKRRAGAGEDEVSRLENEAFGAARRDPPPPASAAEDVPAPAADVPPPPAAPPVETAEAPAPPPVAATPPTPAPARDADTWLDDDEIAEPEVPAAHEEPAAPEPSRSGAVPMSDYVAPDEEGEDLLEETPDFLQETPEHDRLWFEQKPPRDFDFE